MPPRMEKLRPDDQKCCQLRESMLLVILGFLTHTGPSPVRGEGRSKLSQEVYLSQCGSGQAWRDTWEERRSRHCLGKGTPPKEIPVHEVITAKQEEKSKGMGSWKGIDITEHPLDVRLCTRHFTNIISLAFQTAPRWSFIYSVTSKCFLNVYYA